MKEQEKSPEKQLNEMESTNIPDAEFKIIGLRMPKERQGRMNDLSENLNKERVIIKGIKKNPKGKPVRNE